MACFAGNWWLDLAVADDPSLACGCATIQAPHVSRPWQCSPDTSRHINTMLTCSGSIQPGCHPPFGITHSSHTTFKRPVWSPHTIWSYSGQIV
eukprot:13415-Chlamydomonas_euryale.AAC.1